MVATPTAASAAAATPADWTTAELRPRSAMDTGRRRCPGQGARCPIAYCTTPRQRWCVAVACSGPGCGYDGEPPTQCQRCPSWAAAWCARTRRSFEARMSEPTPSCMASLATGSPHQARPTSAAGRRAAATTPWAARRPTHNNRINLVFISAGVCILKSANEYAKVESRVLYTGPWRVLPTATQGIT